jgi:two-component system OmpR family response regulator
LKRAYRIYLVEDSPILLRLLMDMLGGIPGARIVGHSGHAEVAIQEIVASVPHAVVVDLMLQTGSGFDVLEAMQRLSLAPPALALVLTNFTMPPYRQRAESLGAAYFFDKSNEIVQLFQMLSQLAADHQPRSDANGNHG